MAKSKCMEDEAADSSMRPSKQSRFEFEVFLSFRGEDTRKGFTSHLHKELVQRGIKAFIDSEKLQKGKRIIELFKYIEGSKIFVPIFSKKYADSKWCLMEIAKMVKIADTAEEKRPIIPVFFDVSPSDVKHQRGSFEAAFQNHERNKELDVNEWRNALKRAAQFSGYRLHDTDGTEAELITKIGKNVSGLLSKARIRRKPIGLYFQTNKVMEMLERETDGVCVIGIYGPGGIGKTTIAKDVCNRLLSLSYDGSICFISDVRESAKHHKGLPKLQSQLISDILKENIPLSDVDEGISFIEDRMMSRKKVLLILDDVDDKEQLDAFIAPSKQEEILFGAGSKIIVTTRDKDVLLKHGLKEDQIYALKELNDEHSLQLFSHHAFENDQRMAEFKDLSMEVVKVTGGLPLALQVLGSHFYGIRDEKDWRDELTHLKQVQHKGIHGKLKISYDSLSRGEKCILLDIACFFIGEKKQFPVYMWEDYRYSPSVSLKVLEHKSLISIDYYGRFRMHDQIRDMGRTIVREEGDWKPEKYSRVWDADDIERVLEEAERSKLPHIQGITFRNMGNGHKHFSKRASKAMNRLEMLDQSYYEYEDESYYGNLKYLTLSCGRFRAMGNMVLPRLKVLDLTDCKQLVRTPDFTRLRCLERLVLDSCWSLKEIDESIGHLKKLVFLSMKECGSLEWLPEGVGDLESLEQLDLEGCYRLRRIPVSLRGLKNLSELTIEGCRSLEQFPFFRGKVASLLVLILDDYSSLKLLPDSLGDLKNLHELSLGDCESLEEIPNSIGMLESLETLILGGCKSLKGLPDATGDLKNLKKLNLYGCISLQKVPHTIGRLESLEDLDLGNCTSIARIPDSIGELKKLCSLSLKECKSLKRIPNSIGRLESLKKLNLKGCSSMKEIPDSLGDLKKLRILPLENCSFLEEIPDSIGRLESSEGVNLKGCSSMKEIPDSLGDLKKLRIFSLEDCSVLVEIPDSIGRLESLEELNLKGCSSMKGIPDSLGDLKELRILSLEDCHSLKGIPDSICGLESLKELNLKGCYSMKGIPYSFRYLKSLTHLSLVVCNSLEQFLDSIGCLKSLMELEVDFLPEPSSRAFGELHLDFIGDLFQLKKLTLRGRDCTALSKISYISNLKVLRELSLTGCKDLTDVPGIESLQSLERLDMSGCGSLGVDFMSRLSQASFDHLGYFCITGSRVVPHLIFGIPEKAVEFISDLRCMECKFYLTEASRSTPNFDETSPINVCFQLVVKGKIVFRKTLQVRRASRETGAYLISLTNELNYHIDDFFGGLLMVRVSTSYAYELSTGNIEIYYQW